MMGLANCHEDGKGTKQDTEQAILWYRRAVGHGDLRGHYRIGLIYYDGRGGTEPDRTKALREFEQCKTGERAEASILRAWMCLVSLGRNDEAQQRVDASLLKSPKPSRRVAVLHFFAGRMSANQLLAYAKRIKETKLTDAERLCEMHYYIACERLFAGDRRVAKTHFEASTKPGGETRTEFTSATLELGRLEEE